MVASSRQADAQDETTLSGKSMAKADDPHYMGHRDRLRDRFLAGGREALAEYELLELILFMAIPRRDVKPLAKDLLKKYGAVSAIFHASPEDLKLNGLSDNSVTALKIIRAAAFEMMKQDVINQPILNSWTRLLDYLQATMAHEKKEHFRILFLNKKNQLIADEVQQSGTVDHTPAYPREIVKRALELSATAIILVHNHPSGDSSPSRADIDLTLHIINAARPLGIVIHDHLIVARGGVTSMKNKGILPT